MAISNLQATIQNTRLNFSQTTIKFSGISHCATDHEQKLTVAIFEGTWRLFVTVPKPTANDEPCHLQVSLQPLLSPQQKLAQTDTISITVKLQLFTGETFTSRNISRKWSQLSSGAMFGWRKFASWNEFWHDSPNTRQNGTFLLCVETTYIRETRPAVQDTNLLRNLSRLITGEDIMDTKFLLFSSRRVHYASGKVGAGEPLPVYSSAEFLKSQSDYFRKMLCDPSFSESSLIQFSQSPIQESIESYDYASDSDLGYEEDLDENEVKDEDWDDEIYDETHPKKRAYGIDNADGHEFDEQSDFGMHVNDTDNGANTQRTPSNVTSGKNSSTLDYNTLISSSTESSTIMDDSMEDENMDEPEHSTLPSTKSVDPDKYRTGRVIAIRDTAFVTWNAMIFYLTTSQISFAPLTSRGGSRERSEEDHKKCLPPKPSAKSMYRLADKLGLDDLCELSLNHIKLQLTKDVIFHELFCQFTSRYEVVRDMELDFLFEHWDQLKTSRKLIDSIAGIVRGEQPHAADVMTAIFARANA